MSQAGANSAGGGGGGSDFVTTLTGNNSTVATESANNINVVTPPSGGDGTAVFTGSGSTLTLTFDTLDGYGNLGIGTNALALLPPSTQAYTTAIGAYAASSDTSINGCTIVGAFAAAYTTAGLSNATVIGYSALGVSTGNPAYLVAIGTQAAQSATGVSNTVIGSLSGIALTSGIGNTFLGYHSHTNDRTANYNIAIGYNCGPGGFMASGTTGNTYIGYESGSNYSSSESYNVLIGYGVTGTAGESNTIHLADSGTQPATACYIGGISGVTVTGTAVLCAANGQLGTVVSSKRYKENISPIENETSSVMDLVPVSFNYIKDETKQKHYGLIAEDVEKTFPYLCFYKDKQPESVLYHELPVLLLKEIQKLNGRIEILEKGLK